MTPLPSHKRLERTLILLLIGSAAVYAIISFWPSGKLSRQSAGKAPIERNLSRAEPATDSKQLEVQAIANLIGIGSAELSYRGLKNRYGTLQELVQENLLGRTFSDSAVISNYQYSLAAGDEHFACHADPDVGLGRHYFIDESLDLHYNDSAPASISSPFLSYSKNQSTEKPSPGSPSADLSEKSGDLQSR
jgi:hypothetical protein